MLLVWWSHIVFFTSASQDVHADLHNKTDNSTDLQASSQYYKPYYFNRRPGYPNGNNRLPVYPTNYRPNYGFNLRPISIVNRPASTEAQVVAEIAAYAAGHYCNSAETVASNLGPPGICWDSKNKKLKIGPNLTMENFVNFYSRVQNAIILGGNAEFRNQICEQSRRFNNAAIICVPFKHNYFDDSYETRADVECPANARKAFADCFGKECVCYVDQYHRIALDNQFRFVHLYTNRLPCMAMGSHFCMNG